MIVEVPGMHFVYFTSFSQTERESQRKRDYHVKVQGFCIPQLLLRHIEIEVWSENYTVTNENLGYGVVKFGEWRLCFPLFSAALVKLDVGFSFCSCFNTFLKGDLFTRPSRAIPYHDGSLFSSIKAR
jgi:hypothetical protein